MSDIHRCRLCICWRRKTVDIELGPNRNLNPTDHIPRHKPHTRHFQQFDNLKVYLCIHHSSFYTVKWCKLRHTENSKIRSHWYRWCKHLVSHMTDSNSSISNSDSSYHLIGIYLGHNLPHMNFLRACNHPRIPCTNKMNLKYLRLKRSWRVNRRNRSPLVVGYYCNHKGSYTRH